MCWLTSPGFGLGDLIRRPSNEVVGTILCRVFWSRVFLFQLLFFTVYLILLLTIERWVAVVKPSKYGIAFKGKRLTGYLIFCWIRSFFLTGEGILDSVYEPNSSSHDICSLSSARPKQYSILSWRRSFRAFPWFDCTYTWSWRQTTSQLRQLRARPNYAWRGKMTRMIGLMTYIAYMFFSKPIVFFIFATAGKATVDSALHHYIVFLAFTTICANPFIYGLSNADYRQRCKRVCFP